MTSMYLQYIRAPFLCADFCECRRVESVGSEVGGSGDSEGSYSVEECSDLINIQELCSGTIASPCDCQTSQQCQVYCIGITLLYVNLSITNPHTHARTYARMTHTFTHSVYLPMLEMGHCVYWTVMEMATQTKPWGIALLLTSNHTAVLILALLHQTLIRKTCHLVLEMIQVHNILKGKRLYLAHWIFQLLVAFFTVAHQTVLDCAEETDAVWNIMWPFTPGGDTVTVSCGVDFVGEREYETE